MHIDELNIANFLNFKIEYMLLFDKANQHGILQANYQDLLPTNFEIPFWIKTKTFP